MTPLLNYVFSEIENSTFGCEKAIWGFLLEISRRINERWRAVIGMNSVMSSYRIESLYEQLIELFIITIIVIGAKAHDYFVLIDKYGTVSAQNASNASINFNDAHVRAHNLSCAYTYFLLTQVQIRYSTTSLVSKQNAKCDPPNLFTSLL